MNETSLGQAKGPPLSPEHAEMPLEENSTCNWQKFPHLMIIIKIPSFNDNIKRARLSEFALLISHRIVIKQRKCGEAFCGNN